MSVGSLHATRSVCALLPTDGCMRAPCPLAAAPDTRGAGMRGALEVLLGVVPGLDQPVAQAERGRLVRLLVVKPAHGAVTGSAAGRAAERRHRLEAMHNST